MNIIPKAYTRDYLDENSNIVFRDRELIVEVDKGTSKDDTTFRFKIGDGIKSYSALPYISSLYALFPKVVLYNIDYSTELAISLDGCVEKCLP